MDANFVMKTDKFPNTLKQKHEYRVYKIFSIYLKRVNTSKVPRIGNEIVRETKLFYENS